MTRELWSGSCNGGFANLASKDVKKLLEVINAVKPAVGGDMDSGQALCNGGFANLASKDVKKLLEVINAVKPAVGGDMGHVVKLFATDGFANLASKDVEKLLRSSMR